jgi:S-layer family protein
MWPSKTGRLPGVFLVAGWAVVAGLASASPAPAAEPDRAGVVSPRTYGIVAPTVFQLNAYDFEGETSAVETDAGPEPLMRWVVAGPATLHSGVHLPAGARLNQIDLIGCDDDSGGDITASVVACGDAGTTCAAIAIVSSSGAPGCGVIATGTSTHQIDNGTFIYDVQVTLDGRNLRRFRGVRLLYKLEVSPAPGMQTYEDVPPTNVFYQYIEALAAAGITAGCGANKYCPTDPVNRGQMAVFLSRALGLHFPN